VWAGIGSIALNVPGLAGLKLSSARAGAA